MADKLEVLKGLIGAERVDSLLALIAKKEGEAAVAGLTAKEVTEKAEEAEKPKEEAVEEESEELTPEEEESVQALAEAFDTALSPLVASVEQLQAAIAAIAKQSDETVAAQAAEIKELKAAVKELKGDLPKKSAAKLKGRASESDDTVTTDTKAGPAVDPMNDFMSFIRGDQH